MQPARSSACRHGVLRGHGWGATEGSLCKLDEADLYVGIFAHRYGYIEDGYAQSVTELEFEHAGERTAVLEALAREQATPLVLLGGPGSGKTTFVQSPHRSADSRASRCWS